MARNYAALPYEYLREMQILSDAEFGRLCRALIQYSETGEAVALSGNERFFADRVMMREDRYKQAYQATAERNRENGSKGGRPKKPEETHENPEKPTETQKTESETKSNNKANISPPTGGRDTPPHTPPGAGTREHPDAFEAFWALYPKKKSKGDAKTAWKKLKPSPEVIRAIMDKLPRLIASRDWKRDGGQYIPYPATWLRREGWLDEVPEESTAQPVRKSWAEIAAEMEAEAHDGS